MSRRRWLAAATLLLVPLGLAACSKDVAANSLEVGDCTDDDLDGATGDVDTVDCSEAHRFEVFATYDIDADDGEDYPDEDEVESEAAEGCRGERFSEYVGVPYVESAIHVTYLVPTEDTWTGAGDRTIICFAFEPEDPGADELVPNTVEGSVEGADR